MQVLTVNAYQFNELGQDAKRKAIDWYKNSVLNHQNNLETFEDTCLEAAQNAGFDNIKLCYSFSYSQGDGASFSSATLDLLKFLEGEKVNLKAYEKRVLQEYCVIKIGHHRHYAYAANSDVDFYFNYHKDMPNIEKLAGKICELIQARYLSLCAQIEKDGYKELEYQYSDERVTEEIEENEYLFTDSGSRSIVLYA